MLKDYIGEKLLNHELLTAEEEYSLGVASREGDIQARNKLVSHNIRFAVRLATRFKHNQMTFDEAVSIATFALMKAANAFDPIKHKTRFSTLVYPTVLNALRNEFRRMRSSSWIFPGGGCDSTIDPKSLNPESCMDDQSLQVQAALDRLDAYDQYILKAHYGLSPNKKAVSLRKLAVVEGLSRTAVWNRINRAKERLRAVLIEIRSGSYS